MLAASFRMMGFRQLLSVIPRAATVLVAAAGWLGAQDAEMELVESRIRGSMAGGPPSTATIDTLQASLQANGTWPDIDYASTAQTAWPPRTHLERLRNMARNFVWGTGKGDTVLRDDILRAYDAWILRDPQSTNWWYQSIGTPQQLGEILILMGAEISTDRLNSGLSLVSRSYVPRSTNSGTNTGANRVDRAYASMMRGLLADDAALTSESFLAIGDTILVNSAHSFAEGIQPDHTFQQHGQQLYVNGYGYGYASGILRYAAWGAGTRFGYSDRQRRVILDFMLDGAQWFVRGNTIDHTANGRGLTREGGNSAALGFGAMLDNAIAICGGYRQPELAAFRSRIAAVAAAGAAVPASALVGNRNFWCADSMVHHRPGFSISVKTSSTRTRQPESGNGEGLKNLHLADGVTLIQRSGNEYDSIMPVWDWRRLPGITAEQGTYSLKPPADWGVFGTSTFAGGVSDGTDGIAVFDYSRLGVSALKSWFFINDVMIALGAGVSAPASTAPVLTTVNQVLKSGAVTWRAAGSDGTLATGGSAPGVEWVHHDLTGYFFPGAPGNATASVALQSGTWQSINTSQSATPAEREVFSLHFDHGSAFSNASYGYLVAPGLDLAAMASFPLADYAILRNDAVVQAVRHEPSGLTAATFRTASSAGGVTSNAKACVLVRRSAGFIDLTVSDPSQANTDGITIELDSPAAGLVHADTGVTVESLSPGVRVRIATAKSYGRSFRARFFTRAHAFETIALPAAADSFVFDGAPDRNYGDEATLVVKLLTSSDRYSRESFLRFDLGGRRPVAAALKLTPVISQTPGIHSVHRIAPQSWSEKQVTWNNRPPPATPATSLWLPATDLAVSTDVTSALPADGGVLDLCVATHAPTSDGLVSYASREAEDPAQRPLLEVVVPRAEIDIWRIETFGAAATDPLLAGNPADPDGDGEPNLLEFATGQNPLAGRPAAVALQHLPENSPFIGFIYQKRRNSGLLYRVVWTDDLAAGSWTDQGIPDQNPPPLASDETADTMVILVPAGTGRRFIRLETTLP